MTKSDYSACLDDARRICRSGAEDILHEALLVSAATEGRSDLSIPANRAWLAGVMQNLVRMQRRSEARRADRGVRWEQQRETTDAQTPSVGTSVANGPDMLDRLSPASRQVAVLLMHDLDREEIQWILDLTPDALRQRIRVLRRQLAVAMPDEDRRLMLARAYASRRDIPSPPSAAHLRSHLIAIVRRRPGIGVADPDGHMIVYNRKK